MSTSSRIRKAKPIKDLRQAKKDSDAGNYTAKANLLRKLINENSDEWIIDSQEGNKHPGITHIPTGFRFHLPSKSIPPSLHRKKPKLVKSAFIKSANRFREMLKLRRTTPIIDSSTLPTDHAAYMINAKGLLQNGEPVVLLTHMKNLEARRHELTHLYQHHLPRHTQTLGEQFADISKKTLNTLLPSEIGAHRSGFKNIKDTHGNPYTTKQKLKSFMGKTMHWNKQYSRRNGDHSFAPLAYIYNKFMSPPWQR